MKRRMLQNDSHLVISKDILGNLDLHSSFFDVFKQSYGPYFSLWWQKKKKDPVYVVREERILMGFLKLKVEERNEVYTDIIPYMAPQKRLKISSLKVDSSVSRMGVGRRFMQIIFSEAIMHNVDEIYGTVVLEGDTIPGLVKYLERWGFFVFGRKKSHGIEEDVYINANNKEWSNMLFLINEEYNK